MYKAKNDTYREGRKRRLGRLQPYTSNPLVESHPKKILSPMFIVIQALSSPIRRIPLSSAMRYVKDIGSRSSYESYYDTATRRC